MLEISKELNLIGWNCTLRYFNMSQIISKFHSQTIGSMLKSDRIFIRLDSGCGIRHQFLTSMLVCDLFYDHS